MSPDASQGGPECPCGRPDGRPGYCGPQCLARPPPTAQPRGPEKENPRIGSDGKLYARALRVVSCHRCGTRGRHTFRTSAPAGRDGPRLLKLVPLCPGCMTAAVGK